MYNHARTLFLNVTGTDQIFSDYPGDELIPAEFQQLELPTFLEVIRSRIFGASPDRAMLNYRANQLLQIVSTTELQPYVTAMDARITYDLQKPRVSDDSVFRPVAYRYAGPADADLYLTGSPTRPDVTGRCEYRYQVTVNGETVRIERLTSPPSVSELPLDLTSGLSELYPLPGSGYQFRINTTNSNAAWKVTGFLRPQLSLAEIESNLQASSESYLLSLFGLEKIEPYKTFWNCISHPEFAYRLSGFVLALIYRTEELRNGKR